MPTPPVQPTLTVPEKRPYAAPALVPHGDVQTLTHGKIGPATDQDNGGSFPDNGVEAAPEGG